MVETVHCTVHTYIIIYKLQIKEATLSDSTSKTEEKAASFISTESL